MPIPIDARKRPASVKIHVSTGAGVDITWSDGHASHYEFSYLRDLCPCAACDDERKKRAASKVGGGTSPGALPALPMFKPKPRARSAQAVGNYAIRIAYSDGHDTGIYSFDFLREICPCEECARQFRG